MINQVCIVGNLGHDAELRVTSTGTQMLKFSVCVNKRVKDGDGWTDKPNWFKVTFFGKRSEHLAKRLLKGCKVAVIGELAQDKWEDKSGQTRSEVSIIARDIEPMGSDAKPGENQMKTQTEYAPYDVEF